MWDLVWDDSSRSADMKVTEDGQMVSGDLLSRLVIAALFTNKPIPEQKDRMESRSDYEPAGWHGNHFDKQPGDIELGSHLWTLTRESLTFETEIKAKRFAHEALLPLIQMRLVRGFEIETEIDRMRGMLVLKVVPLGPRDRQFWFDIHPVE